MSRSKFYQRSEKAIAIIRHCSLTESEAKSRSELGRTGIWDNGRLGKGLTGTRDKGYQIRVEIQT